MASGVKFETEEGREKGTGDVKIKLECLFCMKGRFSYMQYQNQFRVNMSKNIFQSQIIGKNKAPNTMTTMAYIKISIAGV
jgi:hypothetical protein